MNCGHGGSDSSIRKGKKTLVLISFADFYAVLGGGNGRAFGFGGLGTINHLSLRNAITSLA